jgi:hypothetical protein
MLLMDFAPRTGTTKMSFAPAALNSNIVAEPAAPIRRHRNSFSITTTTVTTTRNDETMGAIRQAFAFINRNSSSRASSTIPIIQEL